MWRGKEKRSKGLDTFPLSPSIAHNSPSSSRSINQLHFCLSLSHAVILPSLFFSSHPFLCLSLHPSFPSMTSSSIAPFPRDQPSSSSSSLPSPHHPSCLCNSLHHSAITPTVIYIPPLLVFSSPSGVPSFLLHQTPPLLSRLPHPSILSSIASITPSTSLHSRSHLYSSLTSASICPPIIPPS